MPGPSAVVGQVVALVLGHPTSCRMYTVEAHTAYLATTVMGATFGAVLSTSAAGGWSAGCTRISHGR